MTHNSMKGILEFALNTSALFLYANKTHKVKKYLAQFHNNLIRLKFNPTYFWQNYQELFKEEYVAYR